MILVLGYPMPLLDVQLDIAKKMFDVNVFAVVGVMQAFSPLLIAAKKKILNIGLIVGTFPPPLMGIDHPLKFREDLEVLIK
jgi:1-acylglycerone phosphate reductase